jgi:hypothetical protein
MTTVAITADLPHPHASSWQITAFQPGNPGSSAQGSFTLPLFPPGSKEFYAAKAIYDKLDYFQRVEAYISPDGASLGKLAFAGIIRGIEKVEGESGDVYQLTGSTDLALANYSPPFPGELLSNDVTSAILKSYLGVNEPGLADGFNPFVAANYTSTSLISPATAGTWTSTTDDSFNVVSCSTGTGALLISTQGAAANDRWHTQYVEVTGRLSPSSDTTNAGRFGVGLFSSSSSSFDGVLGFVQAFKTGTRWNLNAYLYVYIAGVNTGVNQTLAALSNVDDPQGLIPLTVGVLLTNGGNGTGASNASLVVNGRIVLGQMATSYDPGTVTRYPALYFATPATGSASVNMTNLTQQTRFTPDGPSTASTFGLGSISTATHSMGIGTDPGPTLLEVWTKLATREGWYWRYTPQAYVVGTRTLGTLDFAADPGTDRSTSCIFKRRLGNLLTTRLTANADTFTSGTMTLGVPNLDGAGVAYWRDPATMAKYGVKEDVSLAGAANDFNYLRRHAYHVQANKILIGASGAKSAVVLRDAETTDRWRELDKILIDDPDLGLLNLSARVIGYTFNEDDPKQTVFLDQFADSWVDMPMGREIR